MQFVKGKKIIRVATFCCLSALFLFNQTAVFSLENSAQSQKPVKVEQINTDFFKQLRQTQNQIRKNPYDAKMIDMSSSFGFFPESAKINLTLRDVEIASVLRIIAKEGRKNIVLDDSIQGNISAELKNISLNEAMQIILTSKELEYRIDGNTILVASRPAMAQKGLNRKFIKAFKLNNSNCVEVAQILEASIFNKGLKLDSGSSKSGESSGTALQATPAEASSGSASAPAQAEQSSTGKGSLVSSKTIKGKVQVLSPGGGFGDAGAAASSIKVQFNQPSTQEISVSNNNNGAIVIPDTRTNSVLVAGLQEDVLLAQEAISYLDKPLKQVSIEVSLVELSKNDLTNLGMNFETGKGEVKIGFSPVSIAGTGYNQSNFTFNSSASLAKNFTTSIDALISKNKIKVLANPTITALDGSESLIKMTDRIISGMEVTTNQGATTYKAVTEDVGIVLNILPQIGDDGYVTMRLRPSITSPLGREQVGAGYITLVSTREVILQDTRVKNGETLAIGGLLKEYKEDQIDKLPLLSDIPYIGKIFTKTSTKNQKKELIILITPKIIDDAGSV